MLTLKKKIEQRKNRKEGHSDGRISVRDKLLVREVQDMEQNLPKSCRTHFDDPSTLHVFTLSVSPDEGFWSGGRFQFRINVPEEYNIVPPKVCCLTRIWHPNINEDGEVCLSLLRQSSLDSLGWAPTRTLTDLVWGLNSLFSDLLNFEDPLNVEAAEHFERDKEAFIVKVREYVQCYAKR